MEIREALRKQLSAARPARYQKDDRGWVDDVADALDLDTVDIDVAAAARAYVRNLARDEEGKATQAGNRLLRDFHKNQALPLDWKGMVNAPIALANVAIVNGEQQKVQERVRLRNASARDFEMWAETENEARERDYAARGEAVSGALEIAAGMRATGALTFEVWAETDAPLEESAA